MRLVFMKLQRYIDNERARLIKLEELGVGYIQTVRDELEEFKLIHDKLARAVNNHIREEVLNRDY